jgi:hypothetical protein
MLVPTGEERCTTSTATLYKSTKILLRLKETQFRLYVSTEDAGMCVTIVTYKPQSYFGYQALKLLFSFSSKKKENKREMIGVAQNNNTT